MKKIKIKVTYEGLTEKVKEDFNRLIKGEMIMKLTMYEKVVGYSMTWAEEAVEKYPFTSALVMAIIIDHILWS